MRKILTLCSSLTFAFAGAAASAQDEATEGFAFDQTKVSLSGGLGFYGLELAAAYDVTDEVSVRVPLMIGGLDYTFEDDDGNEIEGALSTDSFGVMVDYFPGASGFYLTGGIMSGGYDLSGSITDPTIDGQAFTGTFTMGIRQAESIAPTLGIGFTSKKEAGVVGYFEFGARVTSLEFYESGAAAVGVNQADIDAALAEVNAEMEDSVSILPYLSFGLTYRF